MPEGGNPMSRRTGEAGQVLPLVAICLAVLMGFAALAVDVGYLQYQQRQQQSAADAAALAGARQNIYSSCANASRAQTAAYADSSSNGFTNNGTSVVVAVNNPPASGPFSGDNCAVQVQVTATHATFFSNLFMPSTWHGRITTQAVATLNTNNNGCIYLLNTARPFLISGTNFYAANCNVLSNNTPVTVSGSNVNVDTLSYAGTVSMSGSNFTGTTQKMLPVTDPCPAITACAYLAANPPPATSCTSYVASGTNGTVLPGCYNDFEIRGSNVTMSPGLYVFNGTTAFTGSNITASGVTIYVTSSGTPPDFSGVNIRLSPPTSGPYAGVQYYQVPANTNPANFNGSNVSVSGLLYAPTAIGVGFNGSNGAYTVLVFGSAVYSGSNGGSFGSPPSTGSLIKQAVLAE